MKKASFGIFAMVLLVLVTACNKQQKTELQAIIEQNVQEELMYTTASYNNYICALDHARSVKGNPFSRKNDIHMAKSKLQSAIDGLEYTAKGVYKIEYKFRMKSNDHVGNEWKKTVYCNGQKIKNGDTVTADYNSTVTIEGIIIENDSVRDIGRDTITLLLKDGENGSVTIVVRENRGRHTGNIAIWEFECQSSLIERI